MSLIAAPISLGSYRRDPLSRESAHRRPRRSWRVFPALLLLPGWMYCKDRPDLTPDPTDAGGAPMPTVTAVAVVPPLVYVTPGAKFVLYARMYDHLKGVLPQHPQLKWTVAAGLLERGRGRDSVRVEALPAATTSATSVTATIGTLSATATIIVLAPGAAAPTSPDSVLGDDMAWSTPDVVLLDDTLASPPVNDSVVAFVKVGLLGNLSGGPGEVARLSANQSFRTKPTTWQTGKNVVDLTSGGSGPSVANTPRHPSFTIWLTSTATEVDSTAEADAAHAVAVFGRQRTGLALRHTMSWASAAGDFLLEQGPEPKLECLGLRTKLEGLGVPAGTSTTFAPESLNVVYVNDIVVPPGEGDVPISAGLAGYACTADPVIGSVIFISMPLRNAGTLTHELGHALGLLEPEWGHTKYLPGFSYTNMMWPYEWDATTVPRSTFSLGEAFRLNIDDHSWARRFSGQARDCDSLGVGRSCPLLEKDLVKLP